MSRFQNVCILMVIAAILALSLITVAQAQTASPSISGSASPDAVRSGSAATISYTLANTFDTDVTVIINASDGNTVWTTSLPGQSPGTHTFAWDATYDNGTPLPEDHYTITVVVKEGTLTGFGYPYEVAVDGSGNIYVTDATDCNVRIFAPGTTTPTTTITGFSRPNGIAVDKNGNIYVTDSIANQLKIFAPGTTTPATTITGFNVPSELTVDDDGNIYLPDVYNNVVKIFAPGTTTPATTLTGFNNPRGVAVDHNGNIYVTDSSNNVVKIFAPGTTTPTTTLTGFNNPIGIAVDHNGNIYVADTFNGQVKIFAPGTTTPATTIVGLNMPFGVAVDDSGNIYATDLYNHRVKAFYSGVRSVADFYIDDTDPVVTCSIGGDDTSGWYKADVPVTLTATDGTVGSGIEVLRYSLDNSHWTTYTGTFTVTSEGTNTVYWECTDRAGNSAAGSQTFKMDKTAPTISGGATTAPNANGWYNHSVRVILTPSDALSGLYDEDFVLDQTFTVEGVNFVMLGISDNATNMAERTVTTYIDLTPPETSGSLSGRLQDGAYTSEVGVTFTATDNSPATDDTSGVDHTEYRVNGGDWTRYTGPFTLSYTSTIHYRSVDRAGNYEPVKSLSFTRICLPPATISMDEMYGRQNTTPTPAPTPTPVSTPTPTATPTVQPTAAPQSSPSPAQVASPTATPSQTPQYSGYLIWLALAGIAIIVVGAGWYFLFFRKQ